MRTKTSGVMEQVPHRPRTVGTAERLLSGAILVAYVAYFAVGNFARPGRMLPTGGLPLAEVLLVGVALAGALRLKPPIPVELIVVSVAFLASSVIGYLQHGPISVLPAAYALRIGATLLASTAVAHGILSLWPDRPTVVIRLIIALLLMQAAIGWAVLVLFPDSSQLWAAMERLGLGFPGDPHQHRLLGPVLDPNYFGNLLVLGAALTAGMMVGQSALWATAAYAGFIASLLMTVSRSSVLGFAVWALTFVGLRTLHGERFRFAWRRWAALGAVTLAVALLMHQTVARLAWRVATTVSLPVGDAGPNVVVEPSAAHRLGGLAELTKLLTNARVLAYGVGYNFLPLVSRSEYIVSAYDASLGNLLVTLGLPFSLVVVWAVVRWVRRAYLVAFNVEPTVADAVLAYLIAAVAMSFFNNLLFYAPFLLLVAVILSAFLEAGEGVELRGRVACHSGRKVLEG